MHERICSVPNCERECEYTAYCRPHYRRWRATGDPQPLKPIKRQPKGDQPILERIFAQCVTTPEGCLVWNGSRNRGGYGRIGWRGQQWMTHRVMWTVQVGPIPADGDWTIDHLCRNRACCNVAHLEVVTRWENTRRGGGLDVAQAKNRTRQFCPNGHRYTPDNTYGDGVGNRMCKTCKRNAWSKRRDVAAVERRSNYERRRAEGATPYQALHARWWEHPERRPKASD